MFGNDDARLEVTLTLEDLMDIYCVSRRTIWRWVAEGRLPRPYAITRRVRRWKASEIQQHLDGLLTTRPGSAAIAAGLPNNGAETRGASVVQCAGSPGVDGQE